MNTQATTSTETLSPLQLIKGDQHPEVKLMHRIHDFWKFCQVTFWPNEHFTREQQSEFKRLIVEHYAGYEKNPNERFKELIERAALIKYQKRTQGKYVGRPADWLRISNKHGLDGNTGWTDELIERRRIVPECEEGSALLARAILHFAENRNKALARSFHKRLVALNQPDLLSIYVNTVANLFCNF